MKVYAISDDFYGIPFSMHASPEAALDHLNKKDRAKAEGCRYVLVGDNRIDGVYADGTRTEREYRLIEHEVLS